MTIKDLIARIINLYNINIINIRNFANLKEIKIGSNNTYEQKVYCTGKGSIEIGKNIHFGCKLGGHWKGEIELQARSDQSRIVLKNNIATNNNLFICSNEYIEIGKNCLIGRDCEFIDFDGHGIEPDKRRGTSGIQEKIIIGDNVWFGNGCKILRGTVIGKNCVVAAGAVVKGTFIENCLIGGVPAKVIRKIGQKDLKSGKQ